MGCWEDGVYVCDAPTRTCHRRRSVCESFWVNGRNGKSAGRSMAPFLGGPLLSIALCLQGPPKSRPVCPRLPLRALFAPGLRLREDHLPGPVPGKRQRMGETGGTRCGLPCFQNRREEENDLHWSICQVPSTILGMRKLEGKQEKKASPLRM